MEAQEIFEKVARHLYAQGGPAFETSTDFEGKPIKKCRYRTLNGKKCAVGCLISDADYSARGMEGMNADYIIGRYSDLASIAPLIPHQKLLHGLQLTHDNTPAVGLPWTRERIEAELITIAHVCGLDSSFLSTLEFVEEK